MKKMEPSKSHQIGKKKNDTENITYQFEFRHTYTTHIHRISSNRFYIPLGNTVNVSPL